MADERARKLAFRLATEWADVVAENFTPGTMEKWGLGYEDIGKRNPGVVMFSASMLGRGGPHDAQPGFGPVLTALSGHHQLHRLARPSARQPLRRLHGLPHPPHRLLRRRRRARPPRGARGAASTSISPSWRRPSTSPALPSSTTPPTSESSNATATVTLRWRPTPFTGARATTVGAPSPARTMNSGKPSPASSAVPPSAPTPGSLGSKAARSAKPSSTMRSSPGRPPSLPDEVMRRCQAAGVPAGAVRDSRDLFTDPQHESRGHFVFMDHPEMGRYASDANCFALSDARPEYRPSPLLGEHTERVMREILGMPPEEYRAPGGRWRVRLAGARRSPRISARPVR